MTPRSFVLLGAFILLVAVPAGAQSQLTTMEQQSVDRQVAAPKLDPGAGITLSVVDTALRDVIGSVAQGVTVRYHSGVTNLEAAITAKFSNATIDDALQTVLSSKGLAFKVTGAKSVFIYPNTPENREKYQDSVHTFTIVAADVNRLGQTLNQALTPAGPDDLRPVIVTMSASRTVTVRATSDMMAKIAKIIADNDKR
jgi:type II secretory pathway component HofQ